MYYHVSHKSFMYYHVSHKSFMYYHVSEKSFMYYRPTVSDKSMIYKDVSI